MPRPRDDYDDEDDARPRRRRYEDDDFDRPRRRPRRKPAGPPVGLIVGLAAGGGLLALVIFAGVAYLLLRPGRPVPVAAPAFAPAVPAPPAARPAPPAAPAGQQQVTITAVRRGAGFAGKPTLEIDYTLAGGFVPGQAVVLVKSPHGTTEATIFGLMGMRPGESKGTWTLEKFGFAGGGFGGRLEVWVEQRLGFAGGIISNTFVLDAP